MNVVKNTFAFWLEHACWLHDSMHYLHILAKCVPASGRGGETENKTKKRYKKMITITKKWEIVSFKISLNKMLLHNRHEKRKCNYHILYPAPHYFNYILLRNKKKQEQRLAWWKVKNVLHIIQGKQWQNQQEQRKHWSIASVTTMEIAATIAATNAFHRGWFCT